MDSTRYKIALRNLINQKFYTLNIARDYFTPIATNEGKGAEIEELLTAYYSPKAFTATKLEIRRALRSVNQEAYLDKLLASDPIMQSDWNDSSIIDFTDAITSPAIASSSIDEDVLRELIIARRT